MNFIFLHVIFILADAYMLAPPMRMEC
jgi:hypothetical protein